MIPVRVILQFARELFFEDSSDEECDVEKVFNSAEETVYCMNDNQFKIHFRLTFPTFEEVLVKFSVLVDENPTNIGYPRMPSNKELMITLWYLGNPESFRYYWFHRWLSYQNCGSKDSPNSYCNRKGYHSVVLQAICDHDMCFTDVYAGEAGSVHDYTLFKKSDIYQGIQNSSILFFDDNNLIEDLAYKLDITLMVGFKDNGNLTRRQQNFNIILSRVRVKIENAFALLKCRFRRLKLLETTRLDLIALIIVSACILHNLCIQQNYHLDNISEINEEIRKENLNNPNNGHDIDEDPHDRENRAIRKRLAILNNLPLILRDVNRN
ncbi:hypothetical protein MML48_4g00017247 [Holotrichia oblita]|uniref:Uncharacterized protein n=1 Tax=Holotrichia oblita TaxID=644536 RepID=A0ACB9TBI8_HOLOL|nr:hypothetical protein MML48_4g00017247 [Holotrichia oblita]